MPIFPYVLNGKILRLTNGVKPTSILSYIMRGFYAKPYTLHKKNNCNSYLSTHFSLQLIKVYLVTMVTAEHIPRADPG